MCSQVGYSGMWPTEVQLEHINQLDIHEWADILIQNNSIISFYTTEQLKVWGLNQGTSLALTLISCPSDQ